MRGKIFGRDGEIAVHLTAPKLCDNAVLDMKHPIGIGGVILIVCDHNQGLAVPLHRQLEQIDDIFTVFAVEISGRFVGKNNRRLGCERPPNRHTLLLPAGKLRRKMMLAVREAQNVHQLINIRPVRLFVIKEERQHHVFFHIQLGNQVICLKNEPDIPPAKNRKLLFLHGVNIPVVNHDLPGGGEVQRAKHVEQRALTGAGRPDHRRELSLCNGKGSIFSASTFVSPTP